MSTRGAYGYYHGYSDDIRENFKVTFNRWDSYPSGLGSDVVYFIKENTIPEMFSYFKNIELVFDNSEEYMELLTDTCSKEGNLSVFNSRGKMPDFFHYLGDSVWCEFAYIINLNNLTLEIFSSSTYGGDKESRLDSYSGMENWNPVKLVAEIPLDYIQDISKSVQDIITEVEKDYFSEEY